MAQGDTCTEYLDVPGWCSGKRFDLGTFLGKGQVARTCTSGLQAQVKSFATSKKYIELSLIGAWLYSYFVKLLSSIIHLAIAVV